MALAEDWANLHQQEKDPARSLMLLRAVHWYRQSLEKSGTLTRRWGRNGNQNDSRHGAPEYQHAYTGVTPPLAEIAIVLKVLNGHTDNVMSVAIAPHGLHAASGSWDKSIRILNLSAGNELKRLDGHTREVESVSWSPDGRYLLSCGQDATVRLWDMEGAREIRQLKGHTQPVFQGAFSPDGGRALTGSADGTLRLWEVETATTGQVNRSCRQREPSGFFARRPPGSFGGTDGTVRLWDLETRTELKKIEAHPLPIWSVVFPPMAIRSRRRAMTAPSACGTRNPARSFASSLATRMRW